MIEEFEEKTQHRGVVLFLCLEHPFFITFILIKSKTVFRMNETTEAGDPCHSYTWSILFCVVMVLALLAWIIALALVCIITINKIGLS